MELWGYPPGSTLGGRMLTERDKGKACDHKGPYILLFYPYLYLHTQQEKL